MCRKAAGLAAGLALVLLAACAYRGGIERPGVLKLGWFSFLNGDDIRGACVAGAPPHYRLVYNGDYNEQLRIYEVVGEGGGGGARYRALVHRGSGLKLGHVTLRDLEAPGRPASSQKHLNAHELAELEGALAESGAFAPPPVGLRLASEQFYWIAATCRAGDFRFNAWRYDHDSDRFGRLRFPDVLLRHDATAVAFNPPRAVPRILQARRGGRDAERPPSFELQIGESGLIGITALF